MSQLLKNQYQILGKIGGGGFGDTYLAEDTSKSSRPECVVKHFKPKAKLNDVTYQVVKARFEREAIIQKKLGEEHDQIPKLYEYFTEGQEFYFVQELIKGQTLSRMLQEDKSCRTEKFTIKLLLKLLPVLDYIHAHEVIHRDIKPDNIIIRDSDSKPVLIDFGAVKEVATTVADVNLAPNSTSIVIGTPGYMPLEQAAGKPVFASDIYSLGVTCAYLLTSKNPEELQSKLTGDISLQMFAPGVDKRLASIIDKALQRDFSNRYSTANDMLADLKRRYEITSADDESRDEDIGKVLELTDMDKPFKTLVANLMNEGRHQAVVEIVRQKIQSQPDKAEYYSMLGRASVQLDDYKEAERAFHKAIEIEPTSERYFELGMTMYAQENWKEAAKHLHKAHEMSPKTLRYEHYWRRAKVNIPPSLFTMVVRVAIAFVSFIVKLMLNHLAITGVGLLIVVVLCLIWYLKG